MRIAILGATSHIAKGLIVGLAARTENSLLLYARNPARVAEFVTVYAEGRGESLPLETFGVHPCDVVINCIGIGDPGRLKAEIGSIFSLTETWDNRVLEFLTRSPETLYINFSSGAAYGTDFSQPVDVQSGASFPLNSLTPADFYGIAKLNSEAKHRAAQSFNIVDLRIFSYFSHFIDLDARFLMSDIVVAIHNSSVFQTTSDNIIRDYVHAEDLLSLVNLVIKRRTINSAYDVYSSRQVSKFELLEKLSFWFGLKYSVSGATTDVVNATGIKDNYYSCNTRAREIGYNPKYDSLLTIRRELEVIFNNPV